MLSFLADSYARLPTPEFSDRATVLARDRDKAVLQTLLDRLCRDEASACDAVDRAVKDLNANPNALDEFLSQQNYRLAYWKTADQQLGYRRFFDVNTLIGLRVEREYVFEETHALILKWLKQGVIDGVRVDHPDGLRDPLQYFQRLRQRAPEAWIVGEKILEPGEWLRDSWPVQGTSGYDFLNAALNVLINPAGLKRLGEHYERFTGDTVKFPTIAHDKKIAVMQEALGSDVNRLTTLLVEICESHRDQRDFTRAEIRRAIREVAGCFSIYRTYVIPDRGEITEEDRLRIERATECAKANRQDIDGLLFDFMRDVLELKITGRRESEFVYRFQQFTSPVMAKGVEDTADYCSNRLTAMNEVGCDPDCDGFTLDHFHDYNARIQKTFPGTMTTLSTHDTKRSDDVRARLVVLTEVPNAFAKAVKKWSSTGKKYRGEEVDRGTEWFLFQTLVGAWPISADRLREYMQKAMREAKLRTSWTSNNTAYEDALNAYIDALLQDSEMTDSIAGFVNDIQRAGQINSLAQTLLKHTSPGVPDLYQGGELWDLSLVDPDNRRPVDYTLRRKLLDELDTLCPRCVMDRIDEGLPKLLTIQRALMLRKQHPDWFSADADYQPLHAHGTQANCIIATQRGNSVITVVPRWSYGVQDWGETTVEVPSGNWRNRLTDTNLSGGRIKIDTLLKDFPVALLTRAEE
jgi:(1->4)-alpha-D-glucan 1-alpha-D-glucosylmutase